MDMKALSLGWGVQSFTLAAMSALGELERVDVAIHADTVHERQATYEFAEKWTPWLEEHGVRVEIIRAKSTPVVNNWGGLMIPAYTITDKGNGQFSRQCTENWKRAPLRRWLQANRNGMPVELWLGISMDEFIRMKDSDRKYITNRFPLIEKNMTRKNCEAWLLEHELEIPVKSSCVFCPYHRMKGWQDMSHNDDGDWDDAVRIDEMIRKSKPPWDVFVHASRKPLAEVDLRTPQEKGQLELWANWDEECEGMCGV